MSPKSRGRPKGRGRPRHHSGSPARQLSQADHVLRDARALEAATRLDAQAAASAWLGEAWAKRSMGERGAEAALVTQLVGAARRRGKPTAYLALHALATIPGEWREEVLSTLAEAPEGTPAPGWTTDPVATQPERPIRVELWRDPWGSVRVYLMHYTEPAEHVLLVSLSTVGGVMIHTLEVGSELDALGEQADELILQDDVDIDEALAVVADALWQTDMYWPPQDDPDYVLTRALAHWRTSGHRTESDWEPLPDDERQALIEAFAAEHGEALALDPSIVEVAADTFIDFGDGYLHGGVLAWNPGEVERFLLDWVHRKVVLDGEAAVAVPDVLRAWVVFALGRKGLADEDIAPVVAAVDELHDDYLDEAADGSDHGPGAEIMARILAGGVDLEDSDAVGRVIGAYNAEQNARRLLDG